MFTLTLLYHLLTFCLQRYHLTLHRQLDFVVPSLRIFGPFLRQMGCRLYLVILRNQLHVLAPQMLHQMLLNLKDRFVIYDTALLHKYFQRIICCIKTEKDRLLDLSSLLYPLPDHECHVCFEGG